MRHYRAIRGLVLSAAIFLAAAGAQAQTVVPSTTAANDAEAASLLQQGHDLEAAGSTSRAVATYREVVKKYPVSKSAAAAQFRVAQLLEESGNLSRAFDAYKDFVEGYPQASEFDQAANAQLAIADDFMKRKRYERADEMYGALLGSAPYAKFAPAAQFKLGQSLESRNENARAIAAYQVVLDRYASSDYADDALYQIGYVQLTEARSRSQDLSDAIEAKNTFEEFLMEYPNSEKAAQARDNLDRMSGRESSDLYSIAQFYDRNSNFRAAVIYYSELVRRQSGSDQAKSANERIEEIRAEVGDDELRSGPERTETSERAAMRRRLQNQVETSALSNYAGPPVADVKPPEELPAPKPELRTSADDVRPLQPDANLPPVEPDLPTE
ncbi:MAG: outer membrane protein assembly factor BamD [Verrucomicrobiota bacterium]|jgi:outer membrane protein assembly factor BamD